MDKKNELQQLGLDKITVKKQLMDMDKLDVYEKLKGQSSNNILKNDLYEMKKTESLILKEIQDTEKNIDKLKKCLQNKANPSDHKELLERNNKIIETLLSKQETNDMILSSIMQKLDQINSKKI